MTTTYEFQPVEGGVPIKSWTRGVPVDDKARDQLARAAQMPFVFKHVAAMPDVHVGIGATVGSVIPTKGAIIPAAVGVDIGCGMMAARTSLMASDLPDHLEGVRAGIERAVPHGRDVKQGKRDPGSWGSPPPAIVDAWATLAQRFQRITDKYPKLAKTNNMVHLGTLGTGNHFIELCLRRARRGVGDAAFGLARGRQRDRQLLHRAGQAGHAPLVREPARRGPRPTFRKGPSISTTMSRRSAGRRTMRHSTGG